MPMTDSKPPVMPASHRKAVPPGQHALVGRLHVRVRADHGAHPPVEVPAHRHLLGGGLGVEVHEHDLAAALHLLQHAVGGAEGAVRPPS